MTNRIFRAIFIVAIVVMLATLILTAGFMFEYFSIIDLSDREYTVWNLAWGIAVPLFIIAAIAVILSLILAARTSKRIVQPINEVNLDDPLSDKPYPEIDPLLTRIAKQQSELKQTDQIRRDFTANVSHELKTPLHAISGYAELLKNGLVIAKDIQPFYEKIYAESQRMSTLVEDIIALSHLDSGAPDMVKEPVDLYSTAQNAVDSLSGIAESAGVELRLAEPVVAAQMSTNTSAAEKTSAENVVSGPESGESTVSGKRSAGNSVSDRKQSYAGWTEQPADKRFMIVGIPELLYEIIYNLCDNGIKYNHPGGQVIVLLERTKKAVILSVRDTGAGIPKAHINRIFERFYRVDKSRSKAVGGTGLGLSIVKHAAELHNASIDVVSKVGRGTTITVSFPKES